MLLKSIILLTLVAAVFAVPQPEAQGKGLGKGGKGGKGKGGKGKGGKGKLGKGSKGKGGKGKA